MLFIVLEKLRSLFHRSSSEPPEPQLRVFEIIDDDLRQNLFSLINTETRYLNQFLRSVLNDDNEKPQDYNARYVLNELLGWPQHERMIKTGQYGAEGFSGPEIILDEGQAYIIAPHIDYYKNHDEYGEGNDRVIEIIESWTVPEGLKEVDSLKFGAQRASFPRALLPQDELQKAGCTSYVILPGMQNR